MITILISVTRLKSLMETEAVTKRFTEILGKDAGLFKASIISAINGNDKLMKCEPMSVIASSIIAATLKLPITPGLGFAHIVPYKDTATFQIGWKGLVQLGLRSGQYKTMNTAVVYEGQLVESNPFTGDLKLDPNAKTSDKIVGYLFYFRLMNGFEKYTYFTTDEVKAHAKRYSASFRAGFGPWVDNFDSQALKTVVKMGLSKWGVLSVDMQTAIVEDESSDGKFPDAVPTEAEPAPRAAESTSSRLRNAVESNVVDDKEMPI